MTRDRNDHYVPDGLYLEGSKQVTEIGFRRDPETGDRVTLEARVAHGKADELNRDATWWWADVSGDETHWSVFRGHRIQIDVAFRTENEREVNDWKGRDEIRARGAWTLALNRQQCWEGFIAADPLATFSRIPEVARKLMEHDAINWFDSAPAAEQLMGRRIYYERTPAVVSSVSVLDQGCVMIKPVGVEAFPPPVYALDRPDDPVDDERDEIKIDLLAAHVWWWRDQLHGDETPKERR